MHFERLLYLIPYCCSLEDLEALGNFMIFESVAFAKAWAFQRLSKECLRADVLKSQGR